MYDFDKLRAQLSKFIEQPEPAIDGSWYTVPVSALQGEWEYINFLFDDETGELITVRLLKNNE